jgi:hypothetical protein
MSGIIDIDFRITQSVARDGTKYDPSYALVVTKGDYFEELTFDEDQKTAIFKMTDPEVVAFAETFAEDTISGSRDYDEGIAILGHYVRWQALLPDDSAGTADIEASVASSI